MNTSVDGPSGPQPFLSDSALRQRAAGAGITLRKPPPEPTTCCGRGCNGCVWEGYWTAMDWWREETLALIRNAEAD